MPGRLPGDVPDPGPTGRFALGAGFDRPLAAPGRPKCGDPDSPGHGGTAGRSSGRDRRRARSRARRARTTWRRSSTRRSTGCPSITASGGALRPGRPHPRGGGAAPRLPGRDGQEPAGAGAGTAPGSFDPPRPGAGIGHSPVRSARPCRNGLAETTIEGGRAPAPAGAGSVPATIAGGVMRSMFLAHVRAASMKAIAGIMIGIGILFCWRRVPALAGAPAGRPSAPSAGGRAEGHRAGSDRGRLRLASHGPVRTARLCAILPRRRRRRPALDRLWADERRSNRPAAEVLQIVRRGLRRTTVGPGRDPAPGSAPSSSGTHRPRIPTRSRSSTMPRISGARWSTTANPPRSTYGLMRVEPKTPAILHALVNWCMHVENHDGLGLGRLDRADASRRARLLPQALSRLGRRGDPETGGRGGEVPDRGPRPLRRRTRIGPGRSSGRSRGTGWPGVEKALRTGSSRERLDALKLVLLGEADAPHGRVVRRCLPGLCRRQGPGGAPGGRAGP